jgi:hypothetical protein
MGEDFCKYNGFGNARETRRTGHGKILHPIGPEFKHLFIPFTFLDKGYYTLPGLIAEI